ncbi:sugar ABC transporter permease [Microlunatus panaciterrae]|uniref:Sorbitol/mannitol transport system permease protein n=1 Tax=Microlunatus panaciterrae TaxID=400768 RepID=A0ABS2RFD1_9ACTN|nr:sugar ABC transporter permease [Microlunatus panaciterrae]MBM7797705.1 sorbitol/mannitol transport system permease protein [Microlunatus panaciterrae]
MTSAVEETPTIQPPITAAKSKKVSLADLKGQDLAQRKFARKLIAPALVAAILITQIPFLATIYYSFQDWNLARPQERSFAGFSNYVAVVTNGAFLPSIWATIRIVGGSMILSLLLGLGLAMLLDREFKGRALARTLLITPFLVMPAAAALIWKYSLLEVNTGMVNWGLGLLGIPPIAWNTDHPALTIVFTLTWQYTPFMMLILLAGLQSQAGDILEAANVDGAGALQTFRYMTLPHLRTYAELAILLGTVFMIQVFDPVNIMTKGAGNTKTIAYLLYERAFIGQQVGEAAAYGVITVILTILFATVALRTLFKIFTEEAR